MLTPAANDPNRKQELERRSMDPVSFGAGQNKLIEDAVADKKKAAAAPKTEKTPQ